MPRVDAVRRRGRSLLVDFDDGSALRCDRDFLPGRRLAVGQEVEAAILARVVREAARHDAERMALRWLAVRPRSRTELRGRLRGAGIAGDVAEETLGRLAEQGYLDDHAFAEAWVDRRQRSRPRSQRMLRSELRQQGVEADLAEAVTADIDDEATALDIAVGQRGRFDRDEWEAYRQRTGGLLLRRGFAGGLSERALRSAWAPPSPVGRG